MAVVSALLLLLFLQSDPAAEGRKALEANDFTKAADLFQAAVNANPKDWQSRFHLALSLSFLNKDQAAIEAYRKVLEEQPDVYEAQLNLGILLLRQKQPAEALPLLSAASAKKPAEYRPAYYLAAAHSDLNDVEKAASGFRKALELQPNSSEARIGLARALVQQGKLDDAAKLYEEAAKADPDFKRAPLELAAQYEKNKLPEKAIEIYRRFPEDAGARERLGELLLEGGNATDAIPELENSYKTSPTSANRLALATAYLRSKQAEKALPLLKQASEAEPNNLELRLYYGRALRDQRNFKAAANEFFQATQIKPDSQQAWNELSAMLISLENYPQALAALDKAQSLGEGENAAYWYFRAMVLDRMKDYKKAMPSYQKFLSMSVGKFPDEEFKARQRVKVIEKELSKR